jgi:hypothetical protein
MANSVTKPGAGVSAAVAVALTVNEKERVALFPPRVGSVTLMAKR